jgi:hypothetical protein
MLFEGFALFDNHYRITDNQRSLPGSELLLLIADLFHPVHHLASELLGQIFRES